MGFGSTLGGLLLLRSIAQFLCGLLHTRAEIFSHRFTLTHVQRGLAKVMLCVHICSGTDKQSGDRDVAAESGIVKRRVFITVPAIDFSSTFDHDLCRSNVAKRSGTVQGRPSREVELPRRAAFWCRASLDPVDLTQTAMPSGFARQVADGYVWHRPSICGHLTCMESTCASWFCSEQIMAASADY